MPERQCEQCGRVGTKQFEVWPPTMVDWLEEEFWLPEFVQCSNKRACYKRWPKTATDDE